MPLLTTQNAKTSKGQKKGYLTSILYLKPADSGGYRTVCPKASDGCKSACLNTAGRGTFDNVQQGRQRKTDLFFADPGGFKAQLSKEVGKLRSRAEKLGLTPCVRINGTSDMPTLARSVMQEHPDIMGYDYTKIPNAHTRQLPNYHLTFSRSESNEADCLQAIENGINVAVVFERLPETYWGRKVVSGDEDDLRFLDEKVADGKGIVIGLTAKGKAKRDSTGFVVRGM